MPEHDLRSCSLRTTSVGALTRRGLLSLGSFLLILAGLHFPEQAAADNTDRSGTMAIGDVTTGTLLFRTSEPGKFVPAPTLNSDVHITVIGIIARATLKQEFINPGRGEDGWVEGIYVFPLPETAAVDHLRMRIGERIIEGQIKERTEAKQIYDHAKRQGARASLVEQERPNIFTTSLANIGPGERIMIEIDYQETIRYDQGTFSLRYPMVVGPRYIPGVPNLVEHNNSDTGRQGWSFDTERVPDASRITPLVQHPREGAVNPINLTIDLTPGFHLGKVDSTSHPVLIVQDDLHRRHITLRDESVPTDRDFILSWEPADHDGPIAASYVERTADAAFALLMLIPPSPTSNDIPLLPREMIYVIDTSGSMAGTSIDQAKSALQAAIRRLHAHDRFNIIQFNSITHRLFEHAQPVTTRTMQQAVRYVETLSANGGTEILPALRLALDGIQHHDRLRQVVFLTDGQIGNEEELFETIHRRLGDSRLFTVGIGSAPNSHFMRKAAEFGRGSFTYIGKTEEVQDRMAALFQKLEHAVVTDLRVTGLDHSMTDIFPASLPDLYMGEPLSLVVKAASLPEHVRISGMIGTLPWRSEISLLETTAQNGISVYWARQKIAGLMDDRIMGQDPESVRHAIVHIALTHHLVSTYTSLVAVDVTPARAHDHSLRTHLLKTNLPHGQQYEAIFGLPKTASNGPLHVLIGVASLTIAWSLGR
jgi:Ca-activated chloride channel family protein